MSKCDDCFIFNNYEFDGMECCATNCNDVKKWITDHDKQIRDEILDNVQLEVSKKIEKQIRDDERTKVLSYLVDNGYIKYGFDAEYLEEQLEREIE